jgi:hypothetical protein
MRRVIIESPYSPSNGYSVDENLAYLRAAMRDCLLRGETPYASHGLYTQPGVLDDTIHAERMVGINAGFAWRSAAAATLVYVDLGITFGMEKGIEDAAVLVPNGHVIEYHHLPGWPR